MGSKDEDSSCCSHRRQATAKPDRKFDLLCGAGGAQDGDLQEEVIKQNETYTRSLR